MSIFLNENSKVIVQGMTGSEGRKHTQRMLASGTAIGIGGDPVIGTTHIDALQAFQDDPETEAIVMIGEIGGDA